MDEEGGGEDRDSRRKRVFTVVIGGPMSLIFDKEGMVVDNRFVSSTGQLRLRVLRVSRQVREEKYK